MTLKLKVHGRLTEIEVDQESGLLEWAQDLETMATLGCDAMAEIQSEYQHEIDEAMLEHMSEEDQKGFADTLEER